MLKKLLYIPILATSLFGFFDNTETFMADFTQKITDEKNVTITYTGSLKASRPNYAKWSYTSPVEKQIYIKNNLITVVEPELEQAIVKKIRDSFDFFKIMKQAKKVDNSTYLATYKDNKFTIKVNNTQVESISYVDEFENDVIITFSNQKMNEKIKRLTYSARIPVEYDLIRE